MAAFSSSAPGLGGSSTFVNLIADSRASGAGSVFGIDSRAKGIEAEEKRLIEKVFGIVDADNSGAIDVKELKEMFRIFGIESDMVMGQVDRIMHKLDNSYTGNIDADTFYKILSEKLDDKSTRQDIDRNFDMIDSKNDRMLDVEELLEVANQLGEDMSKPEIKEMIKVWKKIANTGKEAQRAADGGQLDEQISPEEWYAVMQVELK